MSTFARANLAGEGTYWAVGAGTLPCGLLQDLGLTCPHPPSFAGCDRMEVIVSYSRADTSQRLGRAKWSCQR